MADLVKKINYQERALMVSVECQTTPEQNHILDQVQSEEASIFFPSGRSKNSSNFQINESMEEEGKSPDIRKQSMSLVESGSNIFNIHTQKQLEPTVLSTEEENIHETLPTIEKKRP